MIWAWVFLGLLGALLILVIANVLVNRKLKKRKEEDTEKE